jgi:hypothetical protein
MHPRRFCIKGLHAPDRGRAFVISHFWRRYCERYEIGIKLSSAHHPETDGQMGIANKVRLYLIYSYH